ncbi:hypothetical protein TNCV_1397751 [Trichonephila clavipes]|nr:hypothetical protein TNCV_1397751 [Trichonephila clavipes]
MERRNDGGTCATSISLGRLQEDQICPTVQRTGLSEGSNKVVSKNISPNIDRETLLSYKWLRTMRVLQSPHMGVMLIEGYLTGEVCIRDQYGHRKCLVCSTLLQEPYSKRPLYWIILRL